MSDEARSAPLWRNVVLLIAFLALVAVGVITVLIPEITSEDEPDPASPTPAVSDTDGH